MSNERITENLVRDLLKKNSYYDVDNGVVIEEQKSQIKRVSTLLKTASKSKTGKSGFPEFIISWESDPNFIIVIECKAENKNHQSKDLDKPKDYAVDGVLHYAKHLSKEYSVVAIAVSGTTDSSLQISNYLIPCGSTQPKEFANESGIVIKEIISFDDYYRLSSFDPEVERKRHQDLIGFAKNLHEFIWTTAKIPEEDKPLLVSGTLIALMNNPFLNSFKYHSAVDMPRKWLEAIKDELDKAEIPQAKKDTMLQPYANVAGLPNLGKPDSKLVKKYPQGVLYEVIKEINENVWPFISVYHNFDVVGHFYGEFLKYTGGDKKALGIVLTPRHVTELFCEIANVSKTDTVLDICAGTGGFLISAMQAMLKTAVTELERTDIKKNRLIGIENSPKMFALSASNMILRGDGKANLHQGSCFDDAITKSIRDRAKEENKVLKGKKLKRPNVGFLNPPYAQSKSDAELHELYFVKHMLDQLEKGGIGVAIIPVSCVISPSNAKREILEHHSLKAVMSMPNELFYPVGTITCIVVFEAHIPHAVSKRKTWFGYWRDDGFEKTKHLGRIDLRHLWPSVKKRWIEAFRNNEVHAGESVTAYVTADDEWVAEAYLETDYSTITEDDFEETVKKYAMFKLLGEV
ncbi:SAM-dependent DNA methyltransferase [Vibrio cholerae]|uniref:HsdM family class I SAM-dependent methyltransferase n=1 Tax=Vibrio cholerae TaxID=666 RepID=UPI0006E66228|nr:N-6 DNA methylase [Vibrio cholerae]EGR4427990.1 SAM-dependent DNA methyltransferase [Vibrio cholerae]KQA49059.1 restriction endonuclease [Vibrio cholerae]KQA59022.1 restriction endonuclease [Vibrio cholerae]KQA70648.1 restriction endonuclease [Vibrio cholerae]PAS09650.1 SAM-dependent DNA methyltransferase [Vibrio cholerae]